MTSERAQAYGRVMRILAEVGPSKLQPAEQERIRDAADALLFAEAEQHEVTDTAVADIEELAGHLVASDRWTQERSDELIAAVTACGPVSLV